MNKPRACSIPGSLTANHLTDVCSVGNSDRKSNFLLKSSKHIKLSQHIIGPDVSGSSCSKDFLLVLRHMQLHYRHHIEWLLGSDNLQTVKNPNIYPVFKTYTHFWCQEIALMDKVWINEINDRWRGTHSFHVTSGNLCLFHFGDRLL